jgi:hypothetical protein
MYTAEVDAHFPNLTVGDTLYFAALARTPREIPGGSSREQYAEHLRDVIMAAFGISHTINSTVGNDFIRGVSGGDCIPEKVVRNEIKTKQANESVLLLLRQPSVTHPFNAGTTVHGDSIQQTRLSSAKHFGPSATSSGSPLVLQYIRVRRQRTMQVD